jgi:adenosylcobinamide kinase/adenosylcobinamide-phosphate guanylyltransferase
MLWMIIGGVGSGKSAFAEELALTLGREGIRLVCPPFPGTNPNGMEYSADRNPADRFSWTESDADVTLPSKLNAINLESNIFRAERRVIVIDSLSGWLRNLYGRFPDDLGEAEWLIGEALRQVLSAIISFEGKIIVVTEETFAPLTLGVRERSYCYKLAEANRSLFEVSGALYRLTAGMATEVKGYRVKRRITPNENIYPNR